MSAANHTPLPVLHSQRLTLRQLIPQDEQAIFNLRSNESVARFAGRQPARTLPEAAQFISWINENKYTYWGILLQGTDTVIGTACLWNFAADERSAETGYELLPDFQGQGIMKEALNRLLEYGFDELKLEKIEACTHKDNTPSIKLLQALGFTASIWKASLPDYVMYFLEK